MRCIILSSVEYATLTILFSALSPKRHDFRKKFEHKRCIFIFSTNLFENFLMLRRMQRDVIINVHMPTRTVRVLLFGFESKLNFLNRFCQKYQLLNFMKICSVGTELFHADGEKDMTKLTL